MKFAKKFALFVFEFVFGSAAEAATYKSILEAAENGTAEDIRQMLSAGADVNAQDEEGLTPLMWAAIFRTSVAVTEALIKAGADVNARTKDGFTPLMWAAGHNKSVEVIVNRFENKYKSEYN